jgi:hypothetical protein
MTDLIEVMPFEYQIVESENGAFRVEGVFQRSDVENANKRVYPRRIWEKELGEKRVMEALESRSMYGELDHPSDGKTMLKRVSHVVTNLSLTEDGTVTGGADILPTPNGQILRTLFESGTQVGISSRGSGSVQGGVVQEDFKLGTFDFVARPSTPGALPRHAGEISGKKSRTEGDDTIENVVVTDAGEMDSDLFDKLCQELETLDAGGIVDGNLTESELSTMDFNDIGHDVTVLYNAVMGEQEFSPEFVDAVSEDILNLGGTLTQLAADHPEHGIVISDLLEKVEKSRGAVIAQVPQEIVKEEPMDRLQFIKDRLQERSDNQVLSAEEEIMQEADELRQELEELTDDELIDVALKTGVLEPDGVDEDDDDDEPEAEVTVQDLLDYIEELENDHEEATNLVVELAEALEETEDVDDITLKYEASLNIIQETVGRYQLLQEAVGGEEKAEAIMEAHIQALEAASEVTESGDKKRTLTEDDDVAAVEALLNQDDPEGDAEMQRYVELAESALGLN